MNSGLRKTRLFAIWLLVLITFISCTRPTATMTAIPSGTHVATQTFVVASQQGEWKPVLIIATQAQPVNAENPTTEWVQTMLAENISFSSRLQVKLDMQSNGVNGILLIATKEGDFTLGEPWWKGHKRLEILYERGVLNVLLRDGSQATPAYLSQVQLEPGISEVIVIFDQQAKNIEVQYNNKTVMQISTRTAGDFPNGLFPEGQILGVELTNGPNSSCVVTKLELLAPVSDSASPAP